MNEISIPSITVQVSWMPDVITPTEKIKHYVLMPIVAVTQFLDGITHGAN